MDFLTVGLRRLSLMVLSLALAGWPLFSQSFYGSIVGTVSDTSGASITNAEVTLLNSGTNERRTAQTDSGGHYQFVNLVPGRYQVEVVQSGFKRLTRRDILVEVQSTVRIDAALQVGEMGQVVEVKAESPMLQPETSSLGHVVQSRAVQQMPLNGRSVLNLVALAPGVIPNGQSMGNPAIKSGHARALAAASVGSRGEWAFGAGTKAITWVSRVDGESYVEHGLSDFPPAKTTGLTPGHHDQGGRRYRTLDPQATVLRCFRCHTTGPLLLGDGGRVIPAELGVGCESCHGPGAAHIKAGGGRGHLFQPRALAPAALNDYCGACHRKAEDIADWSKSWNVRHQPAYLSQSACFRVSRKVSCLTCHDQHGPLEERAGAYDAKCAACHAQVRHRTPVASASCAGCHMPAVRTAGNLQFRNHWIGVYGAAGNLVPQRRATAKPAAILSAATAENASVASLATLLPIFEKAFAQEPDSARRGADLGLFLQSIGRPEQAIDPLRLAVAADRRNRASELPATLESLAGTLATLRRDIEAFPLFQEAAEGNDPAVAARCLVAMSGFDERNAEAYLRRALEKEEQASGKAHPRVAIIVNNLALVLRANHDNRGAEAFFRRALAIQEKAFGPNHPAVAPTLSNLGNLLQSTARLPEAERVLRRAVRIFEQRIGPETTELAIAYTNLANLLAGRGGAVEAITLLRRTLRIDESIYGPEHPEVAGDLENLATLLAETGSSQKTKPLLDRALTIYEKHEGAQSPHAVAVREALQALKP